MATTTVRKFAALFEGRTDVYGAEWGECLKAPLDYEAHLKGDTPAGVYLLRDDGTCKAAAADFDADDRTFPDMVRAGLDALGVPSALCRSRRKGWHVWIFFKAPLPAYKARRLLLHVCEMAGAPGTEVFPKQDSLEPGGYGNYIRLPYPGGVPADKDGHRAAWNGTGPLTLEAFLARAGELRITEADLDAALTAASLPLDPPKQRERHELTVLPGADFLPCALKCLEEGAAVGARGVAFFTLAKHCRKTGKDQAQALAYLEHAEALSDGTFALRDLEKIVASAYGERTGKGYSSLGCDEPLWAPAFCTGRDSCPAHRKPRDDGFARDVLDALEAGDPVADARCSDLGNARRLAAQHSDVLRFCKKWGLWLVWDGTRWRLDETGEAMRYAKRVVDELYREAADLGGDQRKSLIKHALRSESGSALKNQLFLAESEAALVITPFDLDASPLLLNCVNGTVNLRDGSLRPHSRGDLLTCLAPVAYNPEAECPRWHQFLNEVMLGRGDLIEFLQLAAGYSLTGSTREQCLFVLHGCGANGKSTFLSVINGVLGDYACHTPSETLMVKTNQGGANNDVARLVNKRMVTADEGEQGQRLAEGLIKQLTGGGTVTARFLHKEFFDFAPRFKLWFATNHKPVIRGADNAIWRRIRLVPWEARFEGDKADKNLEAKLLEEKEGILRWAVDGSIRWLRGGLILPNEVAAATAQYRSESDVLAEFLEEHTEAAFYHEATAGALYARYARWAKETNERAVSQTRLGLMLQERGYRSGRNAKGVRVWFGLTLKTDDDDIAWETGD